MKTVHITLAMPIAMMIGCLLVGCASTDEGPSFAGQSPEQIESYIAENINQPPIHLGDRTHAQHISFAGNQVEYTDAQQLDSGYSSTMTWEGPISGLSSNVRYGADRGGPFVIVFIDPNSAGNFTFRNVSKFGDHKNTMAGNPKPCFALVCSSKAVAGSVASAFVNLVSPSTSGGSYASNSYLAAGGSGAGNSAVHATDYSSVTSDDIVNWIQINPSSIPSNYVGPISFSVNLIGSPARVGDVFVGQESWQDGKDVATVYPATIRYQAGQNMISGTVQVVPHRSGTVTIHAMVINPSGHNTDQSTQLIVN